MTGQQCERCDSWDWNDIQNTQETMKRPPSPSVHAQDSAARKKRKFGTHNIHQTITCLSLLSNKEQWMKIDQVAARACCDFDVQDVLHGMKVLQRRLGAVSCKPFLMYMLSFYCICYLWYLSIVYTLLALLICTCPPLSLPKFTLEVISEKSYL